MKFLIIFFIFSGAIMASDHRYVYNEYYIDHLDGSSRKPSCLDVTQTENVQYSIQSFMNKSNLSCEIANKSEKSIVLLCSLLSKNDIVLTAFKSEVDCLSFKTLRRKFLTLKY